MHAKISTLPNKAALRVGLILFSASLLAPGNITAQQEVPFVATRPMPVGRSMHGTVALENYLYVIGGKIEAQVPPVLYNEANYTRAVMKASIGPNGQLGEWTMDRALPQIRTYITNSTVALNDVVYVVGGSDGLDDIGKPVTKYKTVLMNKPGANGALGEWVESIPFPGTGLSCFTVSATPGFIHIIGGNTDQSVPTDAVLTAVLGADSMIANWEQGPSLPQPLWFHHSAVASGRVWVWGGLAGANSQTTTTKVFSSVISGSGRLSPWRVESSELKEGIYRGANAVAGPFLMSFCTSYTGGRISSDVNFTYLSPKGLSSWIQQPTGLPGKVYVSCGPDYRRGTIYLPGGQLSGQEAIPIREVSFFRLTGRARQTIESLNSQEEIAQSTDIASSAAASSNSPETTEGGIVGFMPYDAARRVLFQGSGKPLIAYFHMPGSAPSETKTPQR